MGKVSIMKRGNFFQYRFEIASQGGKRKFINKSGFKTKRDAYEAGMKFYNEYLNTGRKFEPSNMSFSDYLDYWIKTYCEVNLRYSTILSYQNIIKNYLKENSNKLNEELISIIKSWNEKKINKEFVLYKYEDEYALFIDDYNIYYVKGLEERIRDMIPEQKLPIFVKTVLLPLNDNIIYDSYIQQYNVSLGNNLRKIWHDNYKKLLKENKIKFKL